MDEEKGKKKRKSQEWVKKEDLRQYVIYLKNKYSDLSHIEPDNIVYVAFSKPKSNVKANIRAIQGVWSLFKPEVYILAVHLESWEMMTEQERYYVIYHELLHIPDYGFDPYSKEFKKLNPHDLQDFKSLVYEFGVYKENLEKIHENPDSKTPAETDEDEEEDDDE